MAYVEIQYKEAVQAALDSAVIKNGGTPPAENAEIAEKLAKALKDAFAQLDVNTTVTTAGSPTAQTGTGVGKVQ